MENFYERENYRHMFKKANVETEQIFNKIKQFNAGKMPVYDCDKQQTEEQILEQER